MRSTNGVIKPLRAPEGLPSGFHALMISHPADMAAIRKSLAIDANKSRSVLMSQLHLQDNLALIGPFMGAPYAVALLENLIAWGADQIIYYGWCGAIAANVGIGDIVIPDQAMIDEGTSRCYLPNHQGMSLPDSGIQQELFSRLDVDSVAKHTGAIWTTDAIFNETPEKIGHYQSLNVLAVEMEASALFTVSRYRRASMGCLLAVSDELSGGKWAPGFSNKTFKNTRSRICQQLPRIFMKQGSM